MSTSLHVIGLNLRVFGTGSETQIKQLTKLEAIRKHSKSINEIICGDGFLIYCEKYNNQYQNIWTAGCNDGGQCATNDFD